MGVVKFENKDKVNEIRNKFAHNEICVKDIPHDMLCELFYLAISKIDRFENCYADYDERDWEECVRDQEFIIDELFEKLEDNVKLDLYY